MLNFLRHIMLYFVQDSEDSPFEDAHDLDEVDLRRLETCDVRLQKVIRRASLYYDIKVIEGHRDEIHQNENYENGSSKVKWPDGMHNRKPSLAVDIVPKPVNWEATNNFYYLAGIIKSIAKELGVKLIWGGCWKDDDAFSLNEFNDLVHYQLEIKK